ncbi:BCD family MFS transporter [Sphingomonas sp. M1-B02]|uniref:BCD family MFS transporter n=1 Tax=Sphingomonas sp. M1-B02 TaxID=3114300 RepID=UPI00223F51D2|nr:BCD family MFS transporter [Sphingomonas sp. S6-11]UZK66654.1 BCD family MFS transporter [Sphingomonas sp. S6-11]
MTSASLGWLGIVRLGLVQSAIGAIVMLATSLLNRVMVVEYALPAALPAGLVAWHYAVQLSRPMWGHGSDRGRRRTPWILLGMAILALGAVLAIDAVSLLATGSAWGYALALVAFTMIGAGVGAAGTSLLALLATCVAPERRAAAASITWIMMIAGIVVTAGVAGALIDPFSLPRLATVGSAVAGGAFLLAIVAVWGVEGERAGPAPGPAPPVAPASDFATALREIWSDEEARRFTIFVFLSMCAYSMQDLILEPFAGLLFDYSPGQSTQLSGIQHAGVLAGMVLVGVGGSAFGGRSAAGLRRWIVGGCIGSALALVGLAMAAQAGPVWPLAANIAMLGFANGVFAVAAISTMMALAGGGKASPSGGREGIRMGVWGAAQAVAFGLGGLIGAVGVDAGRALIGSTPQTFTLVFGLESLLFLAAASVARRAPSRVARRAWTGSPA